jgi:hypothetical protein
VGGISPHPAASRIASSTAIFQLPGAGGECNNLQEDLGKRGVVSICYYYNLKSMRILLYPEEKL